jgi:long-chain acyl-CoA synthetase
MQLTQLLRFIVLTKLQKPKNWNTLIELGKASTDIDLEEYRAKVAPEDVLTLIYTSGTTGTPKA